MKLTRCIIQYWWHYIKLDATPIGSMWNEREGLIEAYSIWGTLRYMTFWYILNHEWYKMNNKKFADTSCALEYTQPYDEFLRND